MTAKSNRDFSFARDLVCSICMTKYDNIEFVPVTLLCPHIFCKVCVGKFSSLYCPDCDALFSMEDVTVNRDIMRYLSLSTDAVATTSLHKKDMTRNGDVLGGSYGHNTAFMQDDGKHSRASSSSMNYLSERDLGELPCPPPLNSSSSATSLSTNEAPNCQFCKDSPVASVCQDCSDVRNLCEDCYAFRHRKGVMKNHSRVPWIPSLVSVTCADHQQECLLYCQLDNTPICTLCAIGSHKGHEVYVISEEASAYRKRLLDAVLDLERISREVQGISRAISDRYEEIMDRSLDKYECAEWREMKYLTLDGDSNGKRVISPEVFTSECDPKLSSGCVSSELSGAAEAFKLPAAYIGREVAGKGTDGKNSEVISESNTLSCETPPEPSLALGSLVICNDAAPSDRATCSDITHDPASETKPQGSSRSVAIQEIDKYFTSVRDQLDSRRRDLIEQVHSICQEKADVLMTQLELLALYAASNYSVCFRVKQCLKNQPGAFIFRHQSELMATVMKQVEMYKTIPRVPASSDDIQFTPGPVGSSGDSGREAEVEMAIRSIGRIASNDVDPKLTIVVGETILRAVTLNKDVKLTVLTRDRQGLRVTTGGDGVTCVVVTHPAGVSIGDTVRVIDNSDGSYSVMWKCTAQGDFRLRIFVRGVEIGMSPMDYHVSNTLQRGCIGSEGAGPGQLQNPQGLCCHDGMLYVSDQGNSRVQVFGCDGSYVWSIGSWGRGRRQLQSVNGICGNDGLLYVSDSQNHRIHVFDHDGAYVRYVGSRGIGPGQLQNPQGLCCNKNVLYISDSSNNRIQAFACDGTFMRTIGSPSSLQNPTGICCEHDFLYVCDSDNDRVQVFHIEGSFSRSIGGWGSGPGQMLDPSGVCFYEGLLLVSDRGNHRVLVFTREGTFLRTVDNWRDECDGQIPLPHGICCQDGLVYLSDVSSHRVYILSNI